MPIVIDDFLLDDENEDKIWVHGLTHSDLLSVLVRRYAVERNRKARRATYLVIGRTDNGRCIAIPIEPTHDPYTWRPITAWPCKDHEENWCP